MKVVKSSIDVLSLYSNEKVCILGDMAELGIKSEFYYSEISEYANYKIDKLIAIGKYRQAYCEKFSDKRNCFCFETIEDFEKNVRDILKGTETILIKASRSSRFEKIINILKDKF